MEGQVAKYKQSWHQGRVGDDAIQQPAFQQQ